MSPKERSTRRDVLALLAVLGVPTETLAQDAVAADPRSFRALIDNERVRVLEYRSGPGLGVCGQGMDAVDQFGQAFARCEETLAEQGVAHGREEFLSKWLDPRKPERWPCRFSWPAVGKP